MGILGKIFTWWDGATIGTSLYSWRKGKPVGQDDAGNNYYQSADGKRRWVIYNGANDDAAGTTAVMMLAKFFAAQKNNERTLVFVAFTAEEIGGLTVTAKAGVLASAPLPKGLF